MSRFTRTTVRFQAALAAAAFAAGGTAVIPSAWAETYLSSADSLLVDSQVVARTEGRDVSEVSQEAAYQESVNAVLDPLIAEYEHVYSEAGFEGPNSAYIKFKGSVPSKVLEKLKDRPDIRVEGGAELSRAEADEVSAVAAEESNNVLPSDADFTVVVNVDDGAVEVSVDADVSPDRRAAVSDSVGTAVDRALGDDADASVRVRQDDTLVVSEDSVRGGDKMTPVGKTSTECTAAFPARSGKLAGLMTAGHCNDALSVDGGNKLYRASKFIGGARGDAQWHRSRVSVSPHFRYAWGKYRPVWAHPVPKVGTKVCRFGAVSGNGSGCTTIKYVSACKGKVCQMVMTEGDTGRRPGDSGGPWYYGNNAYGIHNGASVRDGKLRNWFTGSRDALAKMGLSAMIGPR